jgi:ligand-binding sensor domain-containing protein
MVNIMEFLKTRIISICLSGLLLMFLFQIASAGVGDWTTYTNMNSVNQILLQEGKLWCATTGGAAILDINDSAFTRLTNVEGLGGNYLYSVARDTSGSYWWGAQNGTLTKYIPEDDSWKVYSFIVGTRTGCTSTGSNPGENKSGSLPIRRWFCF